jgi:hypothetical protein
MPDPVPTPERPAGLRLPAAGALPGDARATLSSIGEVMISEGADAPELAEEGGLVLGDVLGVGGSSVVRSGVQKVLDREVAVKEGRRDLGRDDLDRVLFLEARVTGMLEHPNIVPVHDVVRGPEDQLRIVMRKVTGATWTTLLSDRDRARAVAGAIDLLEWHLRVVISVCNAVSYAHSVGIVHRDLKPDNVMIGAYGEVYVVDWGLAVTTRDDGPRFVPRGDRQHRMAGTPAFMAPEQVGGQPITERTDVWLLGAMLYALVTGKPPYWGPVDAALVATIREARPPLPERVPPGLAAIVRTAMSPDPADRYPSAEALRAAIERYLGHRGADALVAQARVQLDRLRQRLAEGADRLELYDLYGQCRFGFEQALRAHPDRDDATTGREEAALAMARFELGRRDPDAASVLLAGLPAVPEDLSEALAALRRAREADHADVERLRRDQDPEVGRNARVLVIATLSFVWTFFPLVAPFVEAPLTGGTTYPQLLGVDVCFVTAILASGLVFRRQLLATSFNRWMLGGVLLVMTAQIALDSGTWIAGLDPERGHAFHLFLWFVVAAFCAMVLEARLALPALLYVLGFFVAVAWPRWVYPVISATNAVLLVVVLSTWWSRRPRA